MTGCTNSELIPLIHVLVEWVFFRHCCGGIHDSLVNGCRISRKTGEEGSVEPMGGWDELAIRVVSIGGWSQFLVLLV